MGPPTIHIHMAMAPAPSCREFSIRVSIAAGIAECQWQKPCEGSRPEYIPVMIARKLDAPIRASEHGFGQPSAN